MTRRTCEARRIQGACHWIQAACDQLHRPVNSMTVRMCGARGSCAFPFPHSNHPAARARHKAWIQRPCAPPDAQGRIANSSNQQMMNKVRSALGSSRVA